MKNIKNILTTIGTTVLVLSSSPVSAGDTIRKSQEVLQITEFSDNGQEGKIFQSGKSSFYGKNHHGKKSANGKIFDMHALTCAHMTLPFGTKIKVTNKANGKSVMVTVTDRGGFKKYGRVLDLSEGAFKKIASLKSGVINVTIEKV